MEEKEVRRLSGGAHCCSLLLEAAFLVVYQTARERKGKREGEDRNRTFSKETRSKKTALPAPLEAQ